MTTSNPAPADAAAATEPLAPAGTEVFLLRHGESTFNARIGLGVDPLLVDACLTDLGREQAAAAAVRVRALDLALVVSSPLTRALQTAEIVAGGRVPILVEPLLRELLANSCDVGRAASVLRSDFPAVSFDGLPETWWYDGNGHDARDERGLFLEPEGVFAERVGRLRDRLRALPERRILLVGHYALFLRLTGRRLGNGELVPLTDRP